MPRLFQLWLLVISVGSCVQSTVCSHFYSSLFFLSFFFLWALSFWHYTMCLFSDISFTFFPYFGHAVSQNRADTIHHWKDSSMNGYAWHWAMSADSRRRRRRKNIKSKCNNSRSNTVWNASAWDKQFLKLLLHHGIIQYVLSDLTSLRLPRLRCLIGSTKNTFICAFIHLIKKENY